MTILITGGTGKTGSRLSKVLHDLGHSVLITSRSGNPPPSDIPAVKFDWLDSTTHANPFTETEKLGISAIDRIYLVAPTTLDMLGAMKPFIEVGVEKGVKRFVLLSASSIEIGHPIMGKVHEYLSETKIDYVVLRPSWFFENFGIQWLHTIRDKDEIPSRGEDGKTPFVAADDIADAAAQALTEEPCRNADLIIAGPDLLSFDDVANIASEVLGRKIEHKRHTHDQHVAFYIASGLSKEHAEVLASAEATIALGVEEAAAKSGRIYVGKRHLKDWFEKNKALWEPKS
ncbi:hypothetical protein AX16_004698 [Volvariella volvacea WC 439]|nr:hypothetical protein AX16_004698 [Volvariella volvacea WC 439]